MRTPTFANACAFACALATPAFAGLVPLPRSEAARSSPCTTYTGFLMYGRTGYYSNLPFYLDKGSATDGTFDVTTISSKAALASACIDPSGDLFEFQITNSPFTASTWLGVQPTYYGIYAGTLNTIKLMNEQLSSSAQTLIWKIGAQNGLTAWWDNGNGTSSQMWFYWNASPVYMTMTDTDPTDGPLTLVLPTTVDEYASCTGPVFCPSGTRCTLLNSDRVSLYLAGLPNVVNSNNNALVTNLEQYLTAINPTNPDYEYPQPGVCLNPADAATAHTLQVAMKNGDPVPTNAAGNPTWPFAGSS